MPRVRRHKKKTHQSWYRFGSFKHSNASNSRIFVVVGPASFCAFMSRHHELACCATAAAAAAQPTLPLRGHTRRFTRVQYSWYGMATIPPSRSVPHIEETKEETKEERKEGRSSSAAQPTEYFPLVWGPGTQVYYHQKDLSPPSSRNCSWCGTGSAKSDSNCHYCLKVEICIVVHDRFDGDGGVARFEPANKVERGNR